MKKLLIAIGLGLCLTVSAQQHQSQSFLAVPAVYSTNALTITNLAFPGLVVTTNFPGVTYTNVTGTRVVVTNTSSGSTLNLARTVSLWSDKNGSPVGVGGYWYTNQAVSALTPTAAVISGTMTGGSGANAAITFTFAPVPESSSGMPNIASAPTAAAEEWSFSVTSASGLTTFRTNAPLYLWPGCKGLALKRIVNADTDASSEVIITSLKLNGFVP